MSRTFLFLVLFAFILLGCSQPAVTPTVLPTLTLKPTSTPSSTPFLTPSPTPDPAVTALGALGVNVDGGKIIYNGEEIPGASIDDKGLHMEGVGTIKLEEIAGRVTGKDAALLFHKDDEVAAVYYPFLSTDRWEGIIARDEVIQEDDYNEGGYIRFAESEMTDFVTLEKLFLKPLPPDTQWPEEVCADYYTPDPEDSSCKNQPFGKIEDMTKPPISGIKNRSIMTTFEGHDWVVGTVQVFNPADGTTSHIHYSQPSMEGINNVSFLLGMHRTDGYFALPKYYIGRDFLAKSVGVHWKEYYARLGYLDGSGNVDLHALIVQWLEGGKVPVQMENMLLFATGGKYQ